MGKISYVILSMLFCALAGCSTTHEKWGEHATLMPAWEHIKDSASSAANDPHTWTPLLGAVVFGLGDFDQKTSDWATRHNPLFGSDQNARSTSDSLESLSRANYFITALAAYSGQGEAWFMNKGQGLALGFTARRINGEVTNAIKFNTYRERPDTSDLYSFPSGHTSNATIYASLAAQNAAYMNLSPLQETLWKTSSYTIAGLTAWARVEGRLHYPSDVLAGYALGNFLGAFLNKAFINPSYQDNLQIDIKVAGVNERQLSFTYQW